MFGIAGTHRSGKTTLAEAAAAAMDIEFLKTNVAEVFTAVGLSPKDALPFDKRLDIQNAILRSLETQYALRNGAPFIADRTPFDVMAYTLADVQRDTLDDYQRTRLDGHMTMAQQIINEYLRGVVLLRPLAGQPAVATSAQACRWYRTHHFILLKGLIEQVTPGLKQGFISAMSETDDRDERLEDTVGFFTQVRELYDPKVEIWMPDK
jgi:hypothetical protein